jgi:hypothetical protein
MSLQTCQSGTPTGPLKPEPSRSKLAILLDVDFNVASRRMINQGLRMINRGHTNEPPVKAQASRSN